MTTVAYGARGNNLIKTKQRGIFTFRHAAMGFLLGVFVFPSYFGIDIGFDLTVLRFFEIVLLIFIYKNKTRLRQFISLIKNCKQTKWMLLYFFIVCYTNVLRGFAVNGILYTFFNWICVFYLMYYLIKYEYGVNRFIKIIKKFTIFICVVSLLELVVGFPPFSLLDTLGKSSTNSRFGSTRIMGNCTTTNGFGLYMMLLLPIVAFDEDNRRIDIFKNKWYVILTVLCGFMTGSRLAVGTAVLELILLILFSPKGIRGKTTVYSIIILLIFGSVVFLLQDLSFCKSILQTVFSAVDEVLGTSFAAYFGVSSTTLYNSSHYRTLLWQYTFFGGWLNPLLGQGYDYSFSMYIEGASIKSIDNFYVGQYVTYAYPGLIAWLVMSLSFAVGMFKKIKQKTNPACLVVFIAFIGYFISLWFLDQLQTFPIMMTLFALSSVTDVKEKKRI